MRVARVRCASRRIVGVLFSKTLAGHRAADGPTRRPPRKLRGVNSFSVKSIKRSGKAALTEMRSTVERKYTGQSPSFRETEKLNIEVDEETLLIMFTEMDENDDVGEVLGWGYGFINGWK